MATSREKIESNRRNAARSTGPSEAGKPASRANSLKHGLTGSGVVVAAEDQARVDDLADAFVDQMGIRTALGVEQARQMAVMAARMGRAADQEIAQLASRRRNAPGRFDEAREAEADELVDRLGQDPRGCLRRLRRMPEGLDRLADEWGSLRLSLTRPGMPNWSTWQLHRAAALCGVRPVDAFGTEFYPLSMDLWTSAKDPGDCSPSKDKKEAARQEAAKQALLVLIDAELARLEESRREIDVEAISQDRAESPLRALHDDSPEAARARRYEADAARRFAKAFERLREVEPDAVARPVPALVEPEDAAEPAATDTPSETSADLASFCEPLAEEAAPGPPGASGGPIGDDPGPIEVPEADPGPA